jgi:hypothetical protein
MVESDGHQTVLQHEMIGRIISLHDLRHFDALTNYEADQMTTIPVCVRSGEFAVHFLGRGCYERDYFNRLRSEFIAVTKNSGAHKTSPLNITSRYRLRCTIEKYDIAVLDVVDVGLGGGVVVHVVRGVKVLHPETPPPFGAGRWEFVWLTVCSLSLLMRSTARSCRLSQRRCPA